MIFLHLNPQCLLDHRRQILDNICFQTPQNKGEDFAAQSGRSLGIAPALYWCGISLGKVLGRAEHGRIEEAEQRIKLHEIILDRCARDSESVVGFQQLNSLRNLRPDIFDTLAFVEPHTLPLNVFELLDIVTHKRVSRQHNLMTACLVELAGIAIINVIIELRRELLKLALPVEHERPGHYYQRRQFGLGIDVGQNSNCLNCLSETHVVGQASSDFVLPEIFQPFHSIGLIGAQRSVEARRLKLLIFEFVKALVELAMAFPDCPFDLSVEKFLNLGKIEKRDFHMAFAVGLTRENSLQTRYIVTVEQSAGAVAEFDITVFIVTAQKVGQRNLLFSDLYGGIPLKKINSAAKLQVQFWPYRSYIVFAQLLGTYKPVFVEQSRQSVEQEAGGSLFLNDKEIAVVIDF